MNSLQNILQSKFMQPAPEEVLVDEKTIQFLFEKVVMEYYGLRGKSNVVPLSYKEGVLTLGVYKSLWQSEITLAKEELLESLNKKIGSVLVKMIQIQRK